MATTNYKEVLENALKQIKWRLRPCGTEHYEIMTHRNKRTGLVLHGSTLSMDSTWRNIFGNYGGALVFNLKKCVIKTEYAGENFKKPFVSILPLSEANSKGQHSIFMSFYGNL